MHGKMILRLKATVGAVAGEANRSALMRRLPRKLEDSSHATTAIRDGVVFLLLLLLAAIVLHYCSESCRRPSLLDEEDPPEEDEGYALPGPHIDANTRMRHPRTFYDWVRASNAAAQALEAARQ